jgi:type II secretory pathway pseudopilin PulG
MTRKRSAREGGFSLVELLVTIILALIIFAAMVPLFANALKKSSGDNLRVTATNIAQARIERIRLLAYTDITAANVNSSSFAAGQFGTSFTPASGGKPYTINTTVNTQSNYKQINVTVSWSGTDYQTSVNTIVMDPTAVTSTSTSGPTNTTGPFKLTIAFKNWSEVTSSGVTVQCVNTSPTPNVTTTPAPTKQVPTSSATTVVWTNLPGGLNYLYTVTCHSSYITSTSPSFHLLSDGWLKFDTNPGGS